MIPRIGEPVDPSRTYRLRPGAYVVLPRGRQVLLTLQTEDVADLQLPGGGIDPGEHILAALHREVLEETGWRIAAPRKLGAFRRFVFMPEYQMWAEKLCRVYVARPVRQIAPPSEPHHEAVWMPIMEAVQTLGNPGDRMFLAKVAGV